LETLLPDSLTLYAALTLLGFSFVASALNTAFGVGGGLVMLLALLGFVPAAQALPVQSLVQLGSSCSRAYLLRRYISFNFVKTFGIGSVIGATLGVLIFVPLPLPILKVLLAVLMLWVVWSKTSEGIKVSVRSFSLVGAGAAFGAIFMGATGPLVAAFFLKITECKESIVATNAACFIFLNGSKLVGFLYLGFTFMDWWKFVILMFFVGHIGTMFGKRCLVRFSNTGFLTVYKWALSLVAVQLCVTNISRIL